MSDPNPPNTRAEVSTLSESEDRVTERVEKLLLSTERFHTIVEIKMRLEKLHGVRFLQTEVVAAMGRLKRAGYYLEVRKIGPDPHYRLHDRAAQLPFQTREPGDET
jgi:hypothetical protein